MDSKYLMLKSKMANKLLKKVNELFHFQKTADWETKAKEEILYAFAHIESVAKEQTTSKYEPFVYFAIWILKNKKNQWFDNVELPQEILDKVKLMCGYSTEN